MIRCKLKAKVGFHIREEKGKGKVKYLPGDIMEAEDIRELGGAVNKFEILDPVPEENLTELDEPATTLRIEHRGGGRFNVVNIETDEPLNEDYLTKNEAEKMIGISMSKQDKKTGSRRRK